jgi:hypothetical protein
MLPQYDQEYRLKRQELNEWIEHQRLIDLAQPKPRWSFRDALSRAISMLAFQRAQVQEMYDHPEPLPEAEPPKLATDSGVFRIR